MEYKFRAWYKPLGIMLQPQQIESINFETKVLGVYMDMDGKGYHKLRISDFDLMPYANWRDSKDGELYFKDIVSLHKQSFMKAVRGEITIHKGGWALQTEVINGIIFRQLYDIKFDELTVIGNKWEGTK